MQAGLDEGKANGSRLGPHTRALALIPARAQAGRWPEAAILFDNAIAVAETTGDRVAEARTHQQYGEFLLVRDGTAGAAQAEANFTRALDLAREQGARWWELCAAVSLARLWHSEGKTAPARELLAPVYAGFTEGFWTRDLTDARALLDELG